MNVDLAGVYRRSDDVISREIEGEIIIVPLVAGIGDADDALYTLNDTGKAVWDLLDGVRSLRDVVAELAPRYLGAEGEIERDVCGLVAVLVGRRMLVAV